MLKFAPDSPLQSQILEATRKGLDNFKEKTR